MGDREQVLAKRLLILVGAGYLATQLVLFSVHRPPSWDEAIYLSQVAPGVRAIFFAPSRARGITLLVAPVVRAGGTVAAVRLFLAVASSVALAAAFLVYVPILGLAAPLAALVSGFSWLGLFYGSEVMPNLWTAFLAVAVVGVVARQLRGDAGRWGNPVAATLLGLMALFRPPDALVLGGALALTIVLFRRSSFRVVAWLGTGLALGWAPWLVEMSVRYGGPLTALRRGGSVGHVTIGGVGERVLQHLALTDGPAIGPERPLRIPVGGLLWWAGLAVLSVAALVRSRRTENFAPLASAALAGLALAAEYLLLVAGLAPRFLLPAYTLLSIPAAFGIVSLWKGRGASRAAAAISIALVAVWIGWQGGTAHRLGSEAAAARATMREVGLAVRRLADGRPCAFASSESYPEIAFASGCDGRQLQGTDAGSIDPLQRLVAGGERIFVVLRTPPQPGSPLASVPRSPVPAAPGWSIYELVARGA